jgi:hypothetical protein
VLPLSFAPRWIAICWPRSTSERDAVATWVPDLSKGNQSAQVSAPTRTHLIITRPAEIITRGFHLVTVIARDRRKSGFPSSVNLKIFW